MKGRVRSVTSSTAKLGPSTRGPSSQRMVALLSPKSDKNVAVDFIPLRLDVIDILATQIELRGLLEEGIFRLAGEATKTRDLYLSLKNELGEINVFDLDPHVIASALKLYLREQPIPLIPFELYDVFLKANETSDEEDERLAALIECVEKIPPENKPVFRRLLHLFESVTKNQEKNKMSPENLGIVFGPTLMKPKEETTDYLMKSQAPAQIFSLLMKYHEKTLEILPQKISAYRIFEGPPPLDERDWKVIFASGTTQRYQKDCALITEGQMNNNLFRVKAGCFRIQKKEQVMSYLGVNETLGELAFLGLFQSNVEALAEEHDSEVWVASMQHVLKIFAAEPEVFMKFYWNLAHSLAKKLESFGKSKPGDVPLPPLTPSSSSSSSSSGSSGSFIDKKQKRKSSIISSTFSILKRSKTKVTIYYDGQPRPFTYKDNETFATIYQYVHKKFKCPEKLDKYGFYEIYPAGDLFFIPNTIVIREKLSIMANDNKIVFTVMETAEKPSAPQGPEEEKKEAPKVKILKEFQCKLQKNGRLYVTEHHLAHFAKVLGLERKTFISYPEIISMEPSGCELVFHLSQRKSKMEFKSPEVVAEAHDMIEKVWKAYISTYKSMATSVSSAKLINGLQDLLNADFETSFSRAIVVHPYQPTKESELALKPNEVVLISQKEESGWWYGEVGGRRGYFPALCVDELSNNTDDKSAQASPTREDWDLLLLGGKEVKFKQGEVILQEGDRYQRIFQITDGVCSIEKNFEEEAGPIKKVLGHMHSDETFGEMSFLMGGGATASVVAASDTVEVYIIEAEYLKRMFNKENRLAGRFFRYLATVLERRLRAREQQAMRQNSPRSLYPQVPSPNVILTSSSSSTSSASSSPLTPRSANKPLTRTTSVGISKLSTFEDDEISAPTSEVVPMGGSQTQAKTTTTTTTTPATTPPTTTTTTIVPEVIVEDADISPASPLSHSKKDTRQSEQKTKVEAAPPLSPDVQLSAENEKEKEKLEEEEEQQQVVAQVTQSVCSEPQTQEKSPQEEQEEEVAEVSSSNPKEVVEAAETSPVENSAQITATTSEDLTEKAEVEKGLSETASEKTTTATETETTEVLVEDAEMSKTTTVATADAASAAQEEKSVNNNGQVGETQLSTSGEDQHLLEESLQKTGSDVVQQQENQLPEKENSS